VPYLCFSHRTGWKAIHTIARELPEAFALELRRAPASGAQGLAGGIRSPRRLSSSAGQHCSDARSVAVFGHPSEALLQRRDRFAGSFTDQLPPGYTVNMEFKRITTNPRQMGGVPCLRGLRIPVATVVALVADGQTTEGILALYPDLEADDVREALLFAAEAVRERALPLAAGE